MGRIERGRIVWVTNLKDMRNKPTEDHRGIIITTEQDYKDGKPIQAVFVSSALGRAKPDRMVMLPYHN